MNRFWKVALALALLASVAVDFWYPRGPVERLWDYRAFFAVYGLIGCVAIIVVSKALGKHLLQKPENYYEEGYRGAEGADDVE